MLGRPVYRSIRGPSALHHVKHLSVRFLSMLRKPRPFPQDGLEVIDASKKVEEESLPGYNPEAYYPMRIGDVIKNRYQVVSKLGFGTTSTVWLCRDLCKEKLTYWALKAHVNSIKHNHELEVYRKLGEADSEHPGREHVRACEDNFMLQGPNGDHEIFIMTPLGMSLKRFQDMQQSGAFEKEFVSSATSQILLGLDFLHEADVVHSDLHADNVMIAMADQSVLAEVEELEVKEPSPRKYTGGRTIHISRNFLGGPGPVTISDLGQARIGKSHLGNAMPVQYRAPEVILNMPWGKPIDVWSVGLMAWGLLERIHLFNIYDSESKANNDAHHLAHMTALLGPPPPEFLQRSTETQAYWADDGQWQGPVALPPPMDIESLITSLEGQDRSDFANFIHCCLTWEADTRLSAFEAYFHPWLRGGKLPPQVVE
ncbi:hypothetical protein NLU13_6018 [Sarocladium strictum]|uniref:non-specific serine/threonine protein kinase n=1 Tax=Sarocladium strictum TaxID=5046 RepID=A0AA39GFF9_SARSR|nr:hypothetical protein NLU13_6018 [Sarocladium strictum]